MGVLFLQQAGWRRQMVRRQTSDASWELLGFCGRQDEFQTPKASIKNRREATPLLSDV